MGNMHHSFDYRDITPLKKIDENIPNGSDEKSPNRKNTKEDEMLDDIF